MTEHGPVPVTVYYMTDVTPKYQSSPGNRDKVQGDWHRAKLALWKVPEEGDLIEWRDRLWEVEGVVHSVDTAQVEAHIQQPRTIKKYGEYYGLSWPDAYGSAKAQATPEDLNNSDS